MYLMYNKFMEIFGQRLKELREENGLSQRQLAAIIKTSQPNLQRWEKGQFEPDQKTTIIIADFFNVSIDYLFGRED